MKLKRFEELNEEIGRSTRKYTEDDNNQFSDKNFPTPYGNNPDPKRRHNAAAFDEFENELRDLIDGYSIFLSQEEMKEAINRVI